MTDYDKKFEEDLERAQALSLESLALEQFRNKRLQELSRSTSNGETKKNASGKFLNSNKIFFLQHNLCNLLTCYLLMSMYLCYFFQSYTIFAI